MEIDPGLVTQPSELVTREEPLISLAPAGRVGKKWKKIARSQIGDFGLDALHVGLKRSLIDKKALMIHAVSYVNKLIFIISAEEETIPDPHQICDDLEESLNLIKAAVLAKQHVKDD
ncbi:hypothetical protein TEA_018763 [Camellia sinensis var. sinensis]|uniref:O-acyltransferase WSD1 C-terminal domain-containing protein n=1 Tax=Camellia sinensis var. sinensis TaxID=542762 RepID=A0A4S4ENA5_CAMSN|nr:hypothetical protein TEA_018763 [Camellia sinensis var. sinensis]